MEADLGTAVILHEANHFFRAIPGKPGVITQGLSLGIAGIGSNERFIFVVAFKVAFMQVDAAIAAEAVNFSFARFSGEINIIGKGATFIMVKGGAAVACLACGRQLCCRRS